MADRAVGWETSYIELQRMQEGVPSGQPERAGRKHKRASKQVDVHASNVHKCRVLQLPTPDRSPPSSIFFA